MKELDNIHINFNTIDGHNKTFNYILSPREDGKTTMFVASKAWRAFKNKGLSTMILCRQVNEVTTDLLETYTDLIHEFIDDSIKFTFPSQKDIMSGVCSVKVDDVTIFRVVALAKPKQFLKRLKYYRTAYMFFDEVCVDPTLGESYLKGEAKKLMDVYNTAYRDNPGLKVYCCGNPVSLYNPHLAFWHVDTRKLAIKGEPDESIFQTGDVWCVWRKTLTRELYEKIKQKNPGYSLQGNAGYTDYALNGANVNDANIRIEPKSPNNFRLRYLFQFEDTTIGVFKNNDYSDRENLYYCKEMTTVSKYRDVFCFDFSELSTGGVLVSATERMQMGHLRTAMRNRQVQFVNLEIAYKMQEIYNYL